MTLLPFFQKSLLRIVIFGFSILYTLRNFRGVEYHSGYSGNLYQTLHPESFANNPFMSPTRPTMISLFYKMASVVGEWSLDDRFTVLVYFFLVVGALILVDKTAQLFGLWKIEERLLVLMIMMVDHRFKDNHAVLVSQFDFNPTTLSGPLVFLLFYLLFSEAKWIYVFPLMALLSAISMKNGWFVSIVALAIFIQGLTGKLRKIAFGVLALGGAVGLAIYYFKIRQPMDVALFDYILAKMDNSEANPFLDSLSGNLLFLVFCISGFLVPIENVRIRSKVRLVAGMGFAVFLVGGLYLSYTPDFLKIPYLVPFDVNRALWWPQYLLTFAMMSGVLTWAKKNQSYPVVGVATLFLLFLYALPVSGHRWISIPVLSGLVFLGWRMLSRSYTKWIWSLAILTLVLEAKAFTKMAIARQEAVKVMLQYGVMGDNPTARWMEVDQYLEKNTDPDAKVLAFIRNENGKLKYDNTLMTRSGRSMPVVHRANVHFDLSMLHKMEELSKSTERFSIAWSAGDASALCAEIRVLGNPDYLVIPTEENKTMKIPYRAVEEIHSFTIFKKEGQCAPERTSR